MLSTLVGRHLDRYVDGFISFVWRRGVDPFVLTTLGFLLNLAAGVGFAWGYIFWGGVLILVGGAFDIMDGAVARAAGRTTKFGAFYDSVVDRYSDMVLLFGLLFFYLNRGDKWLVLLASLAMVGTALVPYARARAESLIEKCTVGVMERPERLILLSAGALLGFLPIALLIMVVLTHTTVLQRIHYTWRQLREAEKGEAPAERVIRLSRWPRGGGSPGGDA